MDYTYLYRNLYKGPTKEKKKPFLNKEQIYTRLKKGIIIYQRELVIPPKYDYRISDHPIKKLFIEVKKAYLENHNQIRSWLKVLKSSVARDVKILNYK